MLRHQISYLEEARATGRAVVRTGSGNRAVIEFRWSQPASRKDSGSNVVVTMIGGRIVAMKDYRRARTARRVAGAA